MKSQKGKITHKRRKNKNQIVEFTGLDFKNTIHPRFAPPVLTLVISKFIYETLKIKQNFCSIDRPYVLVWCVTSAYLLTFDKIRIKGSSISRCDWWILQPLKGYIFPYQQLLSRLTQLVPFFGFQRGAIKALMFFGVGYILWRHQFMAVYFSSLVRRLTELDMLTQSASFSV